MTIEAANRFMIASLSDIYDEREAAAVCSLVMEKLTGLSRGLRMLHKSDLFSMRQEDLFRLYVSELVQNRPVQYVLGEAWFAAMPFYVDENVLIPRPETEELAEWLLDDLKAEQNNLSVLDIGTGSGAIPVYIKKKKPGFSVSALDISEKALGVAQKNSRIHNTDIDFILCDIRDRGQWSLLPPADIIISNPPYIPEKQKANLEKHVRNYEPGLALFVPDEDPILFYKIICEFALGKLNPRGALFLEIHHDYASLIHDWYHKQGYTVELKKDFSGNNRMIKAFLP
jgi:release factor glutamine methyltransferase